MGRISRRSLLYDGCYAHIISRSIEKREVFKSDDDFGFFKGLVVKAKKKFCFKVFHYCLMHTHFHFVVGIDDAKKFSEGMHRIKRDYTYEYNRLRKRCGQLWQGRYKSLLIEDEAYLYACGVYVENNPVRAFLVGKAEDWKYSSCRHYCLGEKDLLVDLNKGAKIPEEVDCCDKAYFEKGFGIGSRWFKFNLRKSF